MSSWRNRLKRRRNLNAKPVAIRYSFNDGTVINDYGDGKGQHQAAHRILTAPLGSGLRYRAINMKVA